MTLRIVSDNDRSDTDAPAAIYCHSSFLLYRMHNFYKHTGQKPSAVHNHTASALPGCSPYVSVPCGLIPWKPYIRRILLPENLLTLPWKKHTVRHPMPIFPLEYPVYLLQIQCHHSCAPRSGQTVSNPCLFPEAVQKFPVAHKVMHRLSAFPPDESVLQVLQHFHIHLT